MPFHQRARRTLKEHRVQGYTLNQRRLQEPGIEFEQALALLVAESQPDHKELTVRLIEQFILPRDTAQKEPE
ncbi:MAG: hypothetical protein WBI41_13055 [Azovibrio sp.]|uniref:hypothetical protein n=1 Tax=Azovibrio sp. TaxID=1872673 RepID=UPI003C713E2A